MLAVFVYWLTVSHPDTLTAHQSQIVQGGLENSANYVCMCLTVLHSGKAKRQCASVCWPISNPFQMVLLLTCFVLSSSFIFIYCEWHCRCRWPLAANQQIHTHIVSVYCFCFYFWIFGTALFDSILSPWSWEKAGTKQTAFLLVHTHQQFQSAAPLSHADRTDNWRSPPFATYTHSKVEESIFLAWTSPQILFFSTVESCLSSFLQNKVPAATRQWVQYPLRHSSTSIRKRGAAKRQLKKLTYLNTCRAIRSS